LQSNMLFADAGNMLACAATKAATKACDPMLSRGNLATVAYHLTKST
jgi:hypothetical protein